MRRLLLASLLSLAVIGSHAQTAPAAATLPGATDIADAGLAELRALIVAGEFETAYQRAQALEAEHSGQPDFDYLLGLAALQSGRPAEATLAFERALAVAPDFLGARLDMARARFALGQLDEARESLLELREERPPDAARQVIDEYLQAIEQRQSGTELSAYAELGLGHDSNVANATARESVFVPVLGTSVSLSGSSTQRADAFGALRVGARWDQEIARGWSSSIGADIRARLYRKRVEFDEVDPQLHGTLQYRSGFNTVAVNARHEQMDLDYEQYRKVLSVGVTWIRDVDTSLQLVGFAQHSRVRYTSDANSSSDSNLFLFGVGGVWQPGSRRLTALSGSVYGGRDNDTKARIDGDGALVGLRLGLNHRISADLEGSVVGGAQLTHYDIQNGLFQRKRNDRFAELQGVLRWQFEPLWSLSPQLKLTRNWSNIDINSYQRLEAAVFVRRDFR